jgi:hypothetical protein
MPTADRTTVRAAVDDLVSKLRVNLAANPPTPGKPIRGVAVGNVGSEEFARPYLGIYVVRSRAIAATSDDRMVEVILVARIVADATATDAHGVVLDQIGAIEDYLDSLRDLGVHVGAEGLDNRDWEFQYPKPTAGARVITAEAEQTLIVKVQRAFNRVAAA